MQVPVEDLEIGDTVPHAGFVEFVGDEDDRILVIFNTRASAIFPRGETLEVTRQVEFRLSEYPVELALHHWNSAKIPTPISGDKYYHNKEK